MSSRRSAGFTLIEMIIAMVVISVGLAGVLSAFNAVVRSSSDPLVHKQALALAEEMMEEVMLKPYAVGPGLRAGCDRRGTDDLFDYVGYNENACNIDGSPGLAGYTVAVALATPPAVVPAGFPGGAVTEVTVTVTSGIGNAVALTGFRVNWAPP